MLSDGVAPLPALALNAGSVSVIGEKSTAPGELIAFVDFHTPPPAEPTYTVLPEGSPGSTAMLVTRPLTVP